MLPFGSIRDNSLLRDAALVIGLSVPLLIGLYGLEVLLTSLGMPRSAALLGAVLAVMATMALAVVVLLVLRSRDLAHDFEQHQQMFYGTRAVKLLIDVGSGRIVDANPAACAFYGYKLEAFRQMTIGDINALMPEQATEVIAQGEAGNGALFIYPHRLASGEVRYVEVLSSLVEVQGRQLLYSNIRDVTERRKAEKALRESETRYRSLFENALEGIFRSRHGRFTEVNPAFVRMLGYETKEEVLALEIPGDLYTSPAEHDRLLAEVEQEGGAKGMELHLKRRDETGVAVRSYVRGIRGEAGELAGLEAMLVDVTEQKEFEQQLMASRDRAEEMARLKSSFLANMSHEIRTPLTGIIGFAAVLEEELAGEQRELAKLAKQSGQRLLETLNSVLDLARLEANAVELTPQPLDVVAEVESTTHLFGGIAREKGIALRTETPSHPIWAHLDQGFLHRILTNLISNGVKFTEAGSVRVGVERVGSRAHITVSDTGVGIGEGFRPHLFREFKQESTGLSRTHQGSGLGLAITKRLVDLMDGEISVQSEKGVGTTFSVMLPCSPPEVVRRPHVVNQPEVSL